MIKRYDMPTSLSVVVPAYNEERNVKILVENLYQTLSNSAGLAGRFEIIVVDDGSTDSTWEVLEQLREAGIARVITHDVNRGYGAALRSGFAASECEYIAFIDGDGQLFPEDLARMFRRAHPSKVLIGYRQFRADPVYRRFLGWAFSRIFVPLLIGVRVRDVDCALKILPRDLVKPTLLISNGALINSELLARAIQGGYKIEEMSVRHRARIAGKQSGASIRVIVRVFQELRGLRVRLRRNSADTRASGTLPA